MTFAPAALVIALLAMLPPPVPPDSGLSTPPERKQPQPPRDEQPPADKNKDKEQGPDPAYMTLLPDDGSPWGLPSELAARLAGVAGK